jgi:hypothetical protein
MTKYQDDPNINRRRGIDYGERSNTNMWLAGIAALVIVAGIVAYAVSDDTTTTATNTNKPVATERSTTGSGSASPPVTTGRANTDQGNPASGVQTAPLAKPEAQQPGSSAPATNR